MDRDISQYLETAEMLKVLAHPVRLCIVRGLIQKGECNVGHMQTCLSVPQSTVSQHLQKLRTAGIIEGVRHGLEINYKISDKRVSQLVSVLFDGGIRENHKIS
jgi:ArsR family transcriptional regulator